MAQMAQTQMPSQAGQHGSDTVPEYTQIQRSMITFDVDGAGKKVKLGDGGFGVVYQGRYSALGDIRVAIKRIKNSNYGITAKEQVSLEREACEMYRARHSAVLTVYGLVCDTATDDDQMYCLVTEHMEMGSLHDLIDKCSHPIPWEVKVKMLMSVANGMNYLSSLMTGKNRHLVHGDIKAKNILIDGHFNAKIGDFGIAVLQTITSRSTGVYFKGTITHMAPELLDIPEDEHGNYDPKPTQKSDVWSFGVTMFEVAADAQTHESDHPAYRTPFPVGMNHDQIRAKITRRMGALFTPDQRRKIPAECPGFYWEVMERCCIVDRGNRPGFREVFSSLQEKFYSDCEPSFFGAMAKLYDQFQKQRPSRDEMDSTVSHTEAAVNIQVAEAEWTSLQSELHMLRQAVHLQAPTHSLAGIEDMTRRADHIQLTADRLHRQMHSQTADNQTAAQMAELNLGGNHASLNGNQARTAVYNRVSSTREEGLSYCSHPTGGVSGLMMGPESSLSSVAPLSPGNHSLTRQDLDAVIHEVQLLRTEITTMRQVQMQGIPETNPGVSLRETPGASRSTDSVIKQNYVYLLDNIDPGEIQDYLYQDGLLTDNDMEMISTARTRREMVKVILNRVHVQGARGTDLLAHSLSQTGQSHLCTCLQRSDESEALRAAWQVLRDHMRPDDVTVRLFSRGVLSRDDKEMIRAEVTTSGKSERILEAVQRGGAAGLGELVDALTQTGQGELARALTNTRTPAQ